MDCQWPIPAPPNNQQLDPNTVNVRYTNAAGLSTPIYGVDGAAKCTDQYGGWFYDDPNAPKKVVACPQSCTILQGDSSAKVEVLFGCARQKAPIR